MKNTTKKNNPSSNIRYAGFWVRAVAILFDTIMILAPINILLAFIYGYDSLKDPQLNPSMGIAQLLFYSAIIISFWVRSGQTPGQKALKIIVVDTTTQKTMYYPQAFFRFLSYFISMISIIGFLLPAFRKDKKALHDLIANTTVRYIY